VAGLSVASIAVEHQDRTPEALQRAWCRVPYGADPINATTDKTPARTVSSNQNTVHNDHGLLAGGRGPMQVKQHLRFGESRRESIARGRGVYTATAISYQPASLIVNGNYSRPLNFPAPRSRNRRYSDE